MWGFDDEQDSIPTLDIPKIPKPEEDRGLFSSALHYLNMSSGAVSGLAEYLTGVSDDGNMWDAITRGAEEQPGYNKILRDKLGDEFMDEDPYYAGTALDIALQAVLDPLIFLPPTKIGTGIKAGSKILGVTDGLVSGANVLKKTKAGSYLDNAFGKMMNAETKMFTDTPITWRRALSAESPLEKELFQFAKNRSNLYDEAGEMVSKVAKEPEDVRKFITEYIEAKPDIGKFARSIETGLDPWEKYAFETATEAPKIKTAFDGLSDVTRSQVLESAKVAGLDEGKVKSIFEIGEQAATLEQKYTTELVNRGIISKETGEKFAGGRHIRREYLKNENPSEYARMLRDTGLEEEAKKVESVIRELENKYSKGHPLKLNFKEISQRKMLSQDDMARLGRVMDATHPLAEGGRISSDLISKFDFLKDVADKYGTKEAVDGYYQLAGKGYGALDGLYVPREIGQEIDKVLSEVGSSPSAWRKIVGYWKMGKTILNPASHARNFMSNAVMLNTFGGMGLHDVPIYLAKAAKELKKEGKFYQSAKEATNIFDDTFFKSELGQHLAPKALEEGKSFTSKFSGIAGKTIDKAGELYQGNEKMGKLAAFIYGVEKLGLKADEAGNFANKILFDYGKVPPWVKWLRESGVVPFASFPYLAGIETTKTLWNNPARIGKYYKATNTGTEQEKAEKKLLPDYLSPESMFSLGKGTRMVNGREQNVNKYLDLKYILPFSAGLDIVPGSDGFNTPPALDIASTLISGKEGFSGRDIVHRGMSDSEKAKAHGQYLYQTLTPSFAPPIPGLSDGGYSTQKLIQGVTQRPDSKGRMYTPEEAIGHTIFGLKNTPVNIEEQYSFQVKKIKQEIQAIRSDLNYKLKDARLSARDKEVLVQSSREKINQKIINLQDLQSKYKEAGR